MTDKTFERAVEIREELAVDKYIDSIIDVFVR